MRNTYVTTKFDGFPVAQMGTLTQRPTKVVWHRQGNPGVEGASGIAYGASTGAFSIHYYIDDAQAFEGIPWDHHAFHVLEPRNATKFGLPASGVYGRRGDYNTLGIEMEDESPTSAQLAPGQAYGLSQETRITAVLLGADICRWFPWITPADFIEHADLDPWTRSEDIGDGLNMMDFRLDVADVLAGREPWRTVGKFARGTEAVRVVPAPTVVTYTQADIDGAYDAGWKEGRRDMYEGIKREVDSFEVKWNV